MFSVCFGPDRGSILISATESGVDLLAYSSYDAALRVHEEFGGWFTEVGAARDERPSSAKGRVPVRDTLGLASVFYWSDQYVMFPRVENRVGTFRGVEVYAAFNPETNQVDDSAPVLVVKGHTHFRRDQARGESPAVMILTRQDFDRFMLGERFDSTSTTVEIEYIASDGARPSTLVVPVEYSYELTDRKLRMAVEGLFVEQVGFAWGNARPAFEHYEREPALHEPFFNHLGLYRTGGETFYELVGPSRPAICRRSVSRSEVAAVEGLRRIAPPGVAVISDNVLLAETGGGWRAVGLYRFARGQTIHVEMEVGREQGLLAQSGEAKWLLDALEANAACRSQQATLAERITEDELRRLAAGHEGEQIRAVDIIRIGQEVDWLIDLWRTCCAPDSKGPTVADLLAQSGNEQVRLLLVCKLAERPAWPELSETRFAAAVSAEAP